MEFELKAKPDVEYEIEERLKPEAKLRLKLEHRQESGALSKAKSEILVLEVLVEVRKRLELIYAYGNCLTTVSLHTGFTYCQANFNYDIY
ncbi:hypothetical protein EVAR_10607_1 [Eumeta japonica]|uniref:Uncharacterized protein n=1 Tax=Eumeta variegata TaxID=151549 RepID=A0A4C1U1V5_EUMVA|nr:hypothetical protein EVAR_10607_1 [Eumeta japonica]